jgi:hypothetical protein
LQNPDLRRCRRPVPCGLWLFIGAVVCLDRDLKLARLLWRAERNLAVAEILLDEVARSLGTGSRRYSNARIRNVQEIWLVSTAAICKDCGIENALSPCTTHYRRPSLSPATSATFLVPLRPAGQLCVACNEFIEGFVVE